MFSWMRSHFSATVPKNHASSRPPTLSPSQPLTLHRLTLSPSHPFTPSPSHSSTLSRRACLDGMCRCEAGKVFIHHHGDELLEADFPTPTELFAGLSRIAQQQIHLRRSVELGVNDDVPLPVQ